MTIATAGVERKKIAAISLEIVAALINKEELFRLINSQMTV